MAKIYQLLFLLFSFIPFLGFSQNPFGSPLVKNYDKVIFQGGSRTWQMQQDSRGVMYFANNEGLISFDGKFWNLYPLPNHTITRSLFIDINDRIYVGGQGEFGYFERVHGSSLTYVSLQKLVPKDSRIFSDVWNTVAHGSAIFFRASDIIFELKGETIKVHPAPKEWLFMGSTGQHLYAQDSERGLMEFRNNQWVPIIKDLPSKNIRISSIIDLNKDSTLLYTLDNQDYLLRSGRLELLRSDQILQQLYTPSVARFDTNTFVFATATEGCHIRSAQGKIIQRIGLVEGLQNKNVTAVYVDRQKNIWAAIDNAIAVISYGSAVRYFRPNVENDVTGYSTRIFNQHLYIASSNGVYMAPLAKGVKDHSRTPGVFKLLKGSDRGEAWNLEEVNGKLLLGHNRGLYQIEGERLHLLSQGYGTWQVLPMSSVYPVSRSLVGTYSGLQWMDYQTGNFEIKDLLEGVVDSYRFLEKDDQGVVWASHPYRGIYRMKLSSGSYQTELLTKNNGLPSTFQNYVFNVLNTIVFATERGVYVFDETTQSFLPSERFKVFDGIPIRYLRDDEDGNLWFCSGKRIGVAKYDEQVGKYQIIYFPEIEGIFTSGFENIYTYDRNNVYVGSEKGVIHINYEKYQKNLSKPQVWLSSVVTSSAKDSVIFSGYFERNEQGKYMQGAEQELSLSADFNAFHFFYASPSYGIHEHTTYSYQLKGYDSDWSSWTGNNEKAYTNLPSGKYTFKLKARNNLGEESEVLEYTFVILPPWYKSIWAYMAYGVLGTILIGIVYLWQRKVWHRQQLKFSKELEQMRYIHQLEIEKNEKEIVKLQNEKLENEVLMKNKELASTSMQLMENSDALTKLRTELTKLELTDEEGEDLKRITNMLKDVEKNGNHWDQFAAHFDELNDGFLNRLKIKHPELSRNDLKVCAYLKVNFTSKQIAQLQNITVRGVEVHRYRLRKKLNIDTEISLAKYLGDI